MKFTILFCCYGLLGFSQSQSAQKTIYFNASGYQLTAEHKSTLMQWLESLSSSNYALFVEGFADTVGSEQVNLEYSQLRAQSVAEFLQRQLGESQPISTAYYGEGMGPNQSKPVNKRCVIITVTFQLKTADDTEVAQNQIDSSDATTNSFENDTVITFPQGTVFKIQAKAFYPVPLKNVQFQVVESRYTMCKMLKNKKYAPSASGDCLLSAGMIRVRATYQGKEIQPNRGSFIKIQVPATTKEIKNKLKIYAKLKRGGDVFEWKRIESVSSYQENGKTYYRFEADSLIDFRLGYSVGVSCVKSGPKIKLPKLNKALIVQLYPNESYFSVAEQRSKTKFVLDELKFDKKPFVIIVGIDKHAKPFVAKGYLQDLPLRKRVWGNHYLVKKSFFKGRLQDFTGQSSLNDYMCVELKEFEQAL